jgi:hypothetical protein
VKSKLFLTNRASIPDQIQFARFTQVPMSKYIYIASEDDFTGQRARAHLQVTVDRSGRLVCVPGRHIAHGWSTGGGALCAARDRRKEGPPGAAAVRAAGTKASSRRSYAKTSRCSRVRAPYVAWTWQQDRVSYKTPHGVRVPSYASADDPAWAAQTDSLPQVSLSQGPITLRPPARRTCSPVAGRATDPTPVAGFLQQ